MADGVDTPQNNATSAEQRVAELVAALAAERAALAAERAALAALTLERDTLRV